MVFTLPDNKDTDFCSEFHGSWCNFNSDVGGTVIWAACPLHNGPKPHGKRPHDMEENADENSKNT